VGSSKCGGYLDIQFLKTQILSIRVAVMVGIGGRDRRGGEWRGVERGRRGRGTSLSESSGPSSCEES
jgi:hypothetical protein